MKKIYVFCFLFFLMIFIVSCDGGEFGNTSSETDGILQATETSDSGFDDISSDTDAVVSDNFDNDNETDPHIEVEPITTVLTSITSYQQYISTNKMPKDFISYEKLSSLGEFDSLTFRESGNHFYYHYVLIDDNGFSVMINISNLDEGETLVSSDKSGREIMYIDEISEKNICYNKGYANQIVIYNDIAYRYDREGELKHVSVISGNYMITFSPRETYIETQNKYVYMKFSEYKFESENILTYLLLGNEENVDIESLLTDASK